MNATARLLRALSLVLVGVCFALFVPGEAGAADPLPISIEVKAHSQVAELTVEELRSHLTVHFASSRCAILLVSEKGELAPVLRLVVDLRRWEERREPGGEAVFDYNTGTYRQGIERQIEVNAILTLIDVASGEVVKEKREGFEQAQRTRKNWRWDPEVEARRRSRAQLTKTAERLLCRTAKKYVRDKARER